jgi:hypothetical protein
MIYPDNITESIAIDELTLSKGELYTYVTTKDKKQKNGTLIGFILGTKSEDIIKYAQQGTLVASIASDPINYNLNRNGNT